MGLSFSFSRAVLVIIVVSDVSRVGGGSRYVLFGSDPLIVWKQTTPHPPPVFRGRKKMGYFSDVANELFLGKSPRQMG